MITAGRCKTPSALRTLFQGVVRMSRTPNETEVPTRSSRNKAVVRPVWVMTSPSGRCANTGPGVMNSAGKAMMPVKKGMNNQTRLTKNPSGTFEKKGHAEGQKVKRHNDPEAVGKADCQQQHQQGNDFQARIQPLEQSRLPGDFLGKQGLLQGMIDIHQRPLDKTAAAGGWRLQREAALTWVWVPTCAW
jgi:hypothetical protein